MCIYTCIALSCSYIHFNYVKTLLPEHQHIYSQPVYMQMLQKSL